MAQQRRIEAMTTGPAAHALKLEESESLRRLKAAMAGVDFKVAIAGTARGVGASTVAANLALALAQTAREGLGGAVRESSGIGILDLGTGAKPDLDPWGVKVISLEKLLGRQVSLDRGLTEDWWVTQESLARADWKGIDCLLIALPLGMETVGELSEVLPAMNAAVIVTRPSEEVRDRIRRLWKFFDESAVPVIGVVGNMEGPLARGENAEELGQRFGIPIRVRIPYERRLAAAEAEGGPYVLARRETELSRQFFDVSENLADYLFWLRDEHDQEEEF